MTEKLIIIDRSVELELGELAVSGSGEIVLAVAELVAVISVELEANEVVVSNSMASLSVLGVDSVVIVVGNIIEEVVMDSIEVVDVGFPLSVLDAILLLILDVVLLVPLDEPSWHSETKIAATVSPKPG